MHTREVRRAVEELFAAQYDALRSGQPDEVDEFLEAYYAPHSTVIGSSGRALGLEEVRAQILDGDVVMMHALRSVDSISFLGDGESAVATCTAEEVSSSGVEGDSERHEMAKYTLVLENPSGERVRAGGHWFVVHSHRSSGSSTDFWAPAFPDGAVASSA